MKNLIYLSLVVFLISCNEKKQQVTTAIPYQYDSLLQRYVDPTDKIAMIKAKSELFQSIASFEMKMTVLDASKDQIEQGIFNTYGAKVLVWYKERSKELTLETKKMKHVQDSTWKAYKKSL